MHHTQAASPAGASGNQQAPQHLSGQVAEQLVGQRAAWLSVLRRRVQFVARFIYWTLKHGSTKHAGWVCNYEGTKWN